MARPRKSSKPHFTDNDYLFGLDRYREAFQKGKRKEKNYPGNPLLLTKIINALLKRIEDRTPHKAGMLFKKIQFISAMEEVWDLERKDPPIRLGSRIINTPDLEEYFAQALNDLRDVPVSGSTHSPWTILRQKEILELLFVRHEFPERARNPLTKAEWFEKKQEFIKEDLEWVPCYCNYTNGVMELSKQKIQTSLKKPGIHLKHVILAALHNTTPAFIIKLCKPKRSSK